MGEVLSYGANPTSGSFYTVLSSSSAPCPAGIPQDSAIFPTLFNIPTNYLEDTLTKNNPTSTHKYTWMTAPLMKLLQTEPSQTVQESTNQVMNGVNDKMAVNPRKTNDFS